MVTLIARGSHTCYSDLIARLRGPHGESVTLQNHGGPSPFRRYTLNRFAGTDPRGTWRLSVTDDVGIDLGYLQGFTLQLKLPVARAPRWGASRLLGAPAQFAATLGPGHAPAMPLTSRPQHATLQIDVLWGDALLACEVAPAPVRVATVVARASALALPAELADIVARVDAHGALTLGSEAYGWHRGDDH